MTNRITKAKRLTTFLMVAASVLVAQLPYPAAAEEAGVLAVNSKANVQSLTALELRNVVSGQKRTWQNGLPIMLVLPPAGSPELQWLCSQLKMPEATYMRYIKEKMYRGQMQFVTVANANEAKAMLGSMAGGIGPLPNQQVTEPLVQVAIAAGTH
ncbi:MAG: hypothetical protein AAB426_05770 [Myxococcota bacterium]